MDIVAAHNLRKLKLTLTQWDFDLIAEALERAHSAHMAEFSRQKAAGVHPEFISDFTFAVRAEEALDALNGAMRAARRAAYPIPQLSRANPMTTTYPHSAEISHDAFGADFLIGFEYRITSPGAKATYDDPAEPMEYEIDARSITLRLDCAGAVPPAVEVPAWLQVTLSDWLAEDVDGAVYDKIASAYHGPDPDAMRDAQAAE